jgi:phospho-N-acetylmuramoyl-pentapeptide-transferase
MLEQMNGEMVYEMVLALGAFLLAMFLTPIYTKFAYKYKWWKQQKKVTLTGEKLTVIGKLHAEKIRRHFPTMAGAIGVIVVLVVTFLCNFDRAQTWLPLAAFVGGGVIGLIDDIINVFGSGKGAAGLRAPVKFALISALGLFLGWFFAVKLGWSGIYVPFIGVVGLPVVVMILLFAFAVVATSNAVNISDGLDGLAGGLCMVSYGAFGVIALLQAQWGLAGFCFTVVGWLLSYIWFNVFPARFMMGDVGSFALGAGLGVVAMMTNAFLLLPVIGILFVVEAGSSLIQVTAKKIFHRKVFIAAPIHHHLEATGWVETKITMRFWVIAGVFAIIGIFLAIGGGIVG